MQVAIITGEASGDRVGAQLAEEIRRLRPAAHVWGSGGRHMERAGVEVVWDSSRFGMVGIAQAVRLLPRLLKVRQSVHHELLRRRPGVLVPVDAGGFNLGFGPIQGLCPWARRHLPDTKILYYFPPGSWRRRLKGTTLAGNADTVATPFPWSESELRRLGVNATFVGHPLLDLVRPAEPTPDFGARYGLDLDKPVVGILPGSRPQEIAHILPVQLEAASIIHRRVPGVQFLVGLAPTVDRGDIVRAVEHLRRRHAAEHEHSVSRASKDAQRDAAARHLPPLVTVEGALVPPDEVAHLTKAPAKRVEKTDSDGEFNLAIVEDATYDVMAASDVLLTASGTATLEAAILHKPMVIVYRMSRWNAPEYLLVRKALPPHIGMPNLLAERRICPEFVQDEATPDNLAREVIDLLLQPERLLHMKADLKNVVSQLGEPGGAARTARMVIALAETNRTAP